MTLLNFVLTLYMIYIRPGSAVSWAPKKIFLIFWEKGLTYSKGMCYHVTKQRARQSTPHYRKFKPKAR